MIDGSSGKVITANAIEQKILSFLCWFIIDLGLVVGKSVSPGFDTRLYTNKSAQLHRPANALKFWTEKE